MCIVDAAHAGILDSNAPFQMKMLCDKSRVHESLQIVIPPDMFATHLPEGEDFCGTFSLDSTAGHLAQSLLGLLIERGENLSRKAARSLTEALLESIGEDIGMRSNSP